LPGTAVTWYGNSEYSAKEAIEENDECGVGGISHLGNKGFKQSILG